MLLLRAFLYMHTFCSKRIFELGEAQNIYLRNLYSYQNLKIIFSITIGTSLYLSLLYSNTVVKYPIRKIDYGIIKTAAIWNGACRLWILSTNLTLIFFISARPYISNFILFQQIVPPWSLRKKFGTIYVL